MSPKKNRGYLDLHLPPTCVSECSRTDSSSCVCSECGSSTLPETSGTLCSNQTNCQFAASSRSAPISQPISHPISQPVSQPISQPTSQPISQTISKPISQPISQPISRPISQPISSISPSISPTISPQASPSISPYDSPNCSCSPKSTSSEEEQSEPQSKMQSVYPTKHNRAELPREPSNASVCCLPCKQRKPYESSAKKKPQTLPRPQPSEYHGILIFPRSKTNLRNSRESD